MKILVIGSGGREHTLVWKLRQSPQVTKLYCAPGNAGIAQDAEIVPIPATNIQDLLAFAKKETIDCTIVGPEQPLMLGIVDLFEQEGMKIFGPTRLAAELEGSKAYAKQFMKKYDVPTAEFQAFSIDQRYEAERYINEVPVPMVLKADGLAAGKGVLICETKDQALEGLDLMFGRKVFGDAGAKLVVEEYLVGEEASVFAVCDGTNFMLLPSAQDHKRIFDGDKGKNTGGMGAYAPAPIVTETIMEKVKHDIIRPTLLGMKHEGRPYNGCLYIGLMITETGPKVIEYNCRFGDPETQVVLPLLANDLIQVILDSINGNLGKTHAAIKDETAVCVVIASGGYPDDYEVDKQILGLDSVKMENDVVVFHAGTKYTKDTVVTSGGRVLGVTATGSGNDLEGTIDKAYRAVAKITFDGAYYRSDIGKKGLERLKQL